MRLSKKWIKFKILAKLLDFDFPISRPVPRQYLRTLLADVFRKPERADYNKYLNWEQLISSDKLV